MTKKQINAIKRVQKANPISAVYNKLGFVITNGYSLYGIRVSDNDDLSGIDIVYRCDGVDFALDKVQTEQHKYTYRIELPTIQELKQYKKGNEIKSDNQACKKPYVLKVVTARKDIYIAFNVNYLIDFMIITDTNYAYIDLDRGKLSSLYNGDNENIGYLLPMRVSDEYIENFFNKPIDNVNII